MLRTATFALVALVCLPAWGQFRDSEMLAQLRVSLPKDRPLVKGVQGQFPYAEAKIVAVAKDGVVVEVTWNDVRKEYDIMYKDDGGFDGRSERDKQRLITSYGDKVKRATLWLAIDGDTLRPGEVMESTAVWRVVGVKQWFVDGKRTTIPHLVELPAKPAK